MKPLPFKCAQSYFSIFSFVFHLKVHYTLVVNDNQNAFSLISSKRYNFQQWNFTCVMRKIWDFLCYQNPYQNLQKLNNKNWKDRILHLKDEAKPFNTLMMFLNVRYISTFITYIPKLHLINFFSLFFRSSQEPLVTNRSIHWLTQTAIQQNDEIIEKFAKFPPKRTFRSDYFSSDPWIRVINSQMN